MPFQDNGLKLTKTAIIEPSPFRRSRVDIIIPMHEQYNKVVMLINSILLATKSNPYKITVVDDGSADATFVEKFREFDKNRPANTEPILQFVRSEEQKGFGAACALGFSRTKSPWCLFVNSDCLVESPNWMYETGRSLLDLKSKNVRMVSARNNLSYPGCPSTIKGNKEDIVDDCILEGDDFLPLFCFMCHRDLFKNIGGFIKPYPYGTYEDEELAFRMKKHGFKQAICGKSWIKHEGGATFKALANKNPKVMDIIDGNRDLCLQDVRKLF